MALDRSEKQEAESVMAMQNPGACPVEFLLSAGCLRSGGCDADEFDRRTIYEDALLRKPEDGRIFESVGACGESEAGSKTDERDGYPGDLSGSQYQPAADGSCGLSVSVEKSFDRETQPGLERRHHVHQTLAGFCLSGGNSRLVLPVRSGLEALEFSGDGILYGGSRRGLGTGKSRHLQHGPGMPVHKSGFYEAIAGAGNSNQHGLTRSGLRQHLQRKALEECQIRRCLSQQLSGHDRSSKGTGKIFPVLRQRAVPSIAGVPNATGGSFWEAMNPCVLAIENGSPGWLVNDDRKSRRPRGRGNFDLSLEMKEQDRFGRKKKEGKGGGRAWDLLESPSSSPHKKNK